MAQEGAQVSALAPGLLCGWGLFETMRAYNGKIIYFDAHLERLKDSAKIIGLNSPYSGARLKGIIRRIIRAGNFKDAYVKAGLYKNKEATDTLIMAKRYVPYPAKKYREGFSAGVSEFRQIEGSILARIKTTDRILYELSFQKAKEKWFDEALILNTYGYITEGTRSNIFLIKGKDIFTPSLGCGCLDGITRRIILDLARKQRIKTHEGKFTLQDLYNADGAFLTNSLMGVMPLTRIEKKRIGGGTNTSTRFFMKKYHSLLYGT